MYFVGYKFQSRKFELNALCSGHSGILNVKETGQKKREKPTTRPHDGLLKENKS